MYQFDTGALDSVIENGGTLKLRLGNSQCWPTPTVIPADAGDVSSILALFESRMLNGQGWPGPVSTHKRRDASGGPPSPRGNKSSSTRTRALCSPAHFQRVFSPLLSSLAPSDSTAKYYIHSDLSPRFCTNNAPFIALFTPSCTPGLSAIHYGRRDKRFQA